MTFLAFKRPLKIFNQKSTVMLKGPLTPLGEAVGVGGAVPPGISSEATVARTTTETM